MAELSNTSTGVWKLAALAALASFVLHVVGFSTTHWYDNDKTHAGLWQFCRRLLGTTVCSEVDLRDIINGLFVVEIDKCGGGVVIVVDQRHRGCLFVDGDESGGGGGNGYVFVVGAVSGYVAVDDDGRGGGSGAVSGHVAVDDDDGRGGGSGAVSGHVAIDDYYRGGGSGAVSGHVAVDDDGRGGGSGAVSGHVAVDDDSRGGGSGAVSGHVVKCVNRLSIVVVAAADGGDWHRQSRKFGFGCECGGVCGGGVRVCDGDGFVVVMAKNASALLHTTAATSTSARETANRKSAARNACGCCRNASVTAWSACLRPTTSTGAGTTDCGKNAGPQVTFSNVMGTRGTKSVVRREFPYYLYTCGSLGKKTMLAIFNG
ncbi:hypothetical protein DPMN_124423 [Dreissena polymorpha]|uniref:Uncharacterized protein n=1 Tax=Dreissena polymorpha TaxID=45954 RepID=A0A9D4JTU0_DREPO|nr:hypothetical protein DPMN_124423 [Dreissena polymorpha]